MANRSERDIDRSAVPRMRLPLALARDGRNVTNARCPEHQDKAQRRDGDEESHIAPTSLDDAAEDDDSISRRLTDTRFE